MLMDAQLNSSFPLSLAGAGEWVRVEAVAGGKNLLKRLLALGISDGSELEIVQRQQGVGMVVRCANTRLALGHGMAHKVMVARLEKA